MNLIRKYLSVLLVMLIIFALPVNASAAERKTIENPKNKVLSQVSYNSDLEKTITTAWDEYVESVNVYRYKILEKDLGKVYYHISDKYPEYFYLGDTLSYSTNNGYISYIYINYAYSKAVCRLKRELLNNKVKIILNRMKGIQGEENKILFLHDYITTHCEYDFNGVSGDVSKVDSISFTAYGALVDGVAVCQGMSDAFVLLCREIGLTSAMANSYSMVHAWNYVRVGDNYYHLDITWADTAEDAGLSFDGKDFLNINGFVSHKYFLKSDEQFNSLEHYSWEEVFEAIDSTTYEEYYWNGVYSHIYYIKGYQYYIKDSKLIKRTPDSGEEKVLYTIEDGGFNVSGDIYIWNSSNAVLAYNYIDNALLINLSDGVYSYNLVTGDMKKVFELSIDGYIAGILYENNTLFYDVVTVKDNRAFYVDEFSVDIELEETLVNYGDFDNNGSVDVVDVLKMRQFLVKSELDLNEFVADLDEDNVVDTKDYLKMLYKIMES